MLPSCIDHEVDLIIISLEVIIDLDFFLEKQSFIIVLLPLFNSQTA